MTRNFFEETLCEDNGRIKQFALCRGGRIEEKLVAVCELHDRAADLVARHRARIEPHARGQQSMDLFHEPASGAANAATWIDVYPSAEFRETAALGDCSFSLPDGFSREPDHEDPGVTTEGKTRRAALYPKSVVTVSANPGAVRQLFRFRLTIGQGGGGNALRAPGSVLKLRGPAAISVAAWIKGRSRRLPTSLAAVPTGPSGRMIT